MTGDYEQATKFLQETDKALSMGTRTAADTQIKKLISTLKDDQGFRRTLVDKIDEMTGSDIVGQVAGLRLKPWEPQSWRGWTLDLGAIFGLLHGLDPKLAALATISSPRIVGELSNALGRAYVLQRGVSKQLPPGLVTKSIYQYGINKEQIIPKKEGQSVSME